MSRVPEFLLFTLIALFTCNNAFTQDDKQLRTLFSSSDLKKLDKADEYRSEADQLNAEVNQLNLEIINTQSSTELSEKTIASKVRNLEKKSFENQVSASDLYEKCNEIKYTIYRKYIDDFWEKNADRESDLVDSKLLEEQAGDNFFQAISYRIDAKKLDGFEKIEKLNSANSLEIQALQNLTTALQVYYDVPPSTAKSEQASTELDNRETQQEGIVNATTNEPAGDEIVLNQDMIDAYNRYMSSGNLSDTTLSTGKITAVSHFDSDKLLALWYEYFYGIRDTSQEILPDEDIVMNRPAPGTADSLPRSANEPIIIENETDLASIGEPGEAVFRVQIAANRTELSQRALSRIYYGTKNVEMINEDGWYKYSVGDFSTYDEASDFRKKSGLNSAFIIAYRKDKESPGRTATINKVPEEEKVVPSENKLPAGLIFRVQLAASRMPMPANQLGKIYKGNNAVEEISEDGWYKYQLMGVRLYSDARKMANTLGTKGYIVAYEDGKKIALSDAIAKNNDLERMVAQSGRKGHVRDTEFHVQLAASRNPIQSAELKELYDGPEPIFVVIEDGWYKYHLKAGGSYALAQELKKNCIVKTAFIVAYVRGSKANTYQAVQETMK